MLTQKLMGAAGLGSKPVTYVGAGAMQKYTSASGAATPPPAGAAVGDLLVCAIMARSTLTAEAGWVQSATITGTIVSQRTELWTKIADSGDLSSDPVFTQSSSNRFLTQMLAFRKENSSPEVITSDTRVDTSDFVATLATVTGDAKGQMAITAGSSVYADGNHTMVLSAGWTQTTPTSGDSIRLGVGYIAVDAGDDADGTLTIGSVGISSNSWPMVAILLG